jgi:molecular chaperone IbpA
MRTFDLSPLFRSTVGFDHLNHLLETATHIDETALSYPPYNIEKFSDDRYRITMAVAGFEESDLEITAKGQSLVIAGKVRKEEPKAEFLHRGIAGRSFERRFELADHIRVERAALANGLLHVDLVREIPEAMKPRTIKVESQADAKLIESKAA